jgi:hypothetical protein
MCTADVPTSGRAGLVGTQNIRNNESREGGLDYIVQSGTIIEAVDNQPWSGEANVHVSIANWVKHTPINIRFTDREKELVASQLLIPGKPRLWFKTEAPVGLKRRRKAGQGSASKIYELDFRETWPSIRPFPTRSALRMLGFFRPTEALSAALRVSNRVTKDSG